ncbi:uncharacterized protein LOC105431941 [Pogonomyrmex barbatus]|uniref:Uncharacterized protein LOC105431941 n=1 Tax=Pogonomyrmex barbatus TaxID=144034 RepID=A0A6I9WRD1_9HYME|nr:uncharacterized protein LOC105431941 [Pogonomyrmex barbatus]
MCKLHFKKYMFLNYEQTRLQPHAIPSSILISDKEDTTQNETSEVLLDTEPSISMLSSIETQTEITYSSSVGTQISLSLSANSPKVYLYRNIQKYKKQTATLELTSHQKDKEEDINIYSHSWINFIQKKCRIS